MLDCHTAPGSRVDMAKSFHGHLPGFDGFAAGTGGTNLVQTVVTKDLTKFLSTVPCTLKCSSLTKSL